MAEERQLYAMVLPGFWMDIGQPPDYLVGMRLYLASRAARAGAELTTGENIRGAVIVVSPHACLARGLCSSRACPEPGGVPMQHPRRMPTPPADGQRARLFARDALAP